ncbi:MAG: Do family serine endopeptidase, partial [Paludibacteraceae bacterium]|nr:Do family serine endopeptidase [Paludibacteraceae bacterium]
GSYYNPYSDPIFEYFFGPQMQQQPQQMPSQEASGSGVILSSDGYIVTNNHVIDRATEIEVILNDKRTFTATLVGTDPNTDIALLKVEATDLPSIRVGNSDNLRVGEWVLAVGNPFNLTSTVTAGIVSAKARNINILNSAMKIESFIQTDAAVNPGNSGGALVNTNGELVGINTAIASQTGNYAGYAFAVPTSIVSKVVADLKQYGTVQRAVLGVQIQDIDAQLAQDEHLETLDGVYVAGVQDLSSAAAAGIKKGDVITSVDQKKVTSSAELQEQIGRHRPGDKVSISVLRGKDTVNFTLELRNSQGTTDMLSKPADFEALGMTFKDLDTGTARQLGISYGLQVSTAKGAAARAGIRADFIIVKANNTAVRSEDDLKQIYQAAQSAGAMDKVLFLQGIYPNGRMASYVVEVE